MNLKSNRVWSKERFSTDYSLKASLRELVLLSREVYTLASLLGVRCTQYEAFSPAIVALWSQQRNAPENLQAHPSFVNLLSGKCTGASCVLALGRDWWGGVRVKGQQERPQRWAFEMSYEFGLPGSHRLRASAAVQCHSATLSRQDWWVNLIHDFLFVWINNFDKIVANIELMLIPSLFQKSEEINFIHNSVRFFVLFLIQLRSSIFYLFGKFLKFEVNMNVPSFMISILRQYFLLTRSLRMTRIFMYGSNLNVKLRIWIRSWENVIFHDYLFYIATKFIMEIPC